MLKSNMRDTFPNTHVVRMADRHRLGLMCTGVLAYTVLTITRVNKSPDQHGGLVQVNIEMQM